MPSCTECQANIRKQAAQIALKKIVCRARALILICCSPYRFYHPFIKYLCNILGYMVKLSFLVEKEKKLAEIVEEEVLVLEQTDLR